MSTKEAICNKIRAKRNYINKNVISKAIHINTGDERGYTITAKTQVYYNLATDCITPVNCIVYRKKSIYPTIHGKADCNTEETVKQYNKWVNESGVRYREKHKEVILQKQRDKRRELRNAN